MTGHGPLRSGGWDGVSWPPNLLHVIPTFRDLVLLARWGLSALHLRQGSVGLTKPSSTRLA